VRVVSLLPAATEIVAALGLVDALVGVSHECDWPPEVAAKPRVTHCPIHQAGLASDAVDAWVRERLQASGSLYTLDEALLRELRPDVLLTQGLCEVCAPAFEGVQAVAARLPGPPRVVNLEPRRLADVLDNVRAAGDALDVPARAAAVAAGLEARIAAVRERAAGAPRRRCVLLEWIAPPFRGGHWDAELVELAGGVDPLARAGEPSVEVPWSAVVGAAPEVLVIACCGFDVARTLEDVPRLRAMAGWSDLPAVRTGRVFVVDGSAYFSRPGPRLVDSLELLATLIHPERFAGRHPDRGAVPVAA
jgi:iron complex transport system substrate-binding protein